MARAFLTVKLTAGRLPVAYRRVAHAAHYEGGGGHDLEQWDVTGDLPRSKRSGDPLLPVNLPKGAEYHSGYVRDGVQHWLFVRRAPLSGECAHCAGRAALVQS